MNIYKYDVVQIDLNPRKGHTQAGVRPCVVIQGDIFNKYSPTVVVVPLTSTQKDVFPSEFLIEPSPKNGLDYISRFLGSQIITVDKSYIQEKKGVLDTHYHDELHKAISISLDLGDI